VGRRFLAQAGIVGQAERIDNVGVGAAAAAPPEWPDGSPPDRIGADVSLDLVGVEAGEIVPFLVVFADVLEAEPAMFVQPVARPGRAVLAAQPAARRLAHPLVQLRAIRRRQGFRSPSGHSANMCSTVWLGKRGK